MTENSYESPKEQSEPSHKADRAKMATGCLLVAALFPAVFICGGITCYSVGIAGEAVNTEAGWALGILLVVALVFLLAYLLIRRSKRERGNRPPELPS